MITAMMDIIKSESKNLKRKYSNPRKGTVLSLGIA